MRRILCAITLLSLGATVYGQAGTVGAPAKKTVEHTETEKPITPPSSNFDLETDVLAKPEVIEPNEPPPLPERIYTHIEQNAEFPGDIKEFIKKNLQYPAKAQKKGIAGQVVVEFMIDREGLVQDVKILRDIGGGCGAEAVRVVKLMPAWKPAQQNGKVIRSWYTLPVNFGPDQ